MDNPTPSDGETDPSTLAAQERWLDLARLGKDAWNTWAEAELKKPEEDRADIDLSGQEIDVSDFIGFIFPARVSISEATFSDYADFSEATFSDYADFSEATFSANADFSAATFSANASFREATFSAYADFREATFSDYADFSEATFSANAYFRQATFSAYADFSRTTVQSVLQMENARISGSLVAQSADIQGHAYFTGIAFRVPPDLISTAFSQPPSFLGSTFEYPCSNRFVGKCSVADGEARFRRLKQLAADTHDHELELSLFASEVRAKRFHSLKPHRIRDLPRLALNYIYEWVSDFGQSWVRPLGWLMLTVLCALYAYEAMLGTPDLLARGFVEFSSIGRVASFANIFPFAGQAVVGREIMVTGLCPMPETDPQYLDCLTRLYTISAVEGVFGLIFLFLIGLGLRNRFRIK